MPWQTVRIFISSTFRDMHAERDYLVRFVFPELRERCAKRRLHLIDVDLRWGLTEEDAERGRALAVCLDEIERCRPFFVGLLGERYGWVPSAYEVPDEPAYDWVHGFESGYSITAMEIYHGVLGNPAMKGHAFFYFRDPAFIDAVPAPHRAVFLPESAEAAEKLGRLKQAIREHGPVFEPYPCAYAGTGEDGQVRLTGLEPLGQRVLDDLWAAIGQEYPEAAAPVDDLAVERTYHDAFIESRTRRFIGRKSAVEALRAYVEGTMEGERQKAKGERKDPLNDGEDAPAPLIVIGAAGSGKSALLAYFARSFEVAHPDAFVLAHFIGASPGSTDLRRTLGRLCGELARRFPLDGEVPEDYEQLRRVFPEYLEQAGARGPVLLLLDAVNQLHGERTLDWLPQRLPAGVRVVVSTLEGEWLDLLRLRRPASPELAVGPLSPEDRKELVRQALWAYRKRLDERPVNDQMGALLNKRDADNPLYLVVACEELRVFGAFERVTERIGRLPDGVPALFDQVLDRLEGDHGRVLAESALSLLACARYGLLESEMLDLLGDGGEAPLPRAVWARLYRSLHPYLRPPGEQDEGALDFFHDQLAQAAFRRYLASDEAQTRAHRRLAAYFRRKADPQGTGQWDGAYPRAFGELPYHQTAGRMWTELEVTLGDLRFIAAKSAAGLTYDLAADYEAALAAWPDYTRYDPFDRPAPEPAPAWLRACVQAVRSGKADPHPDRGAGPILQAWEEQAGPPFVLRLLHHRLFRHSRAGKWLIDRSSRRWTLAAPDAPLPPPGEALAALFGPDQGAQAAIEDMRRAEDPASAGETAIPQTPADRVRAFGVFVSTHSHLLAATPADAVSIARNHAGAGVVVEQAERLTAGLDRPWIARDVRPPPPSLHPARLRTITGHTDWVDVIAVTADGRIALSTSFDRTLRVWDLATGRCLQTLEGPAHPMHALAATPDGRTAVAASDTRLYVWDVPSGACLRTLEGHDAYISGAGLTHDGALAVSASSGRAVTYEGDESRSAPGSDRTLRVWDVSSGRCIRLLEGPAEGYSGVCLTPDGKMAVSWDGNALYIWHVSPGMCIRTIPAAGTVALSSSGRLAFTGREDGEIQAWDLLAGTCLWTRTAHQGEIASLCCTPDGRVAASVDRFGVLVVWDAASGAPLRTFPGAMTDDRGLAMTPDARLLVKAGGQNTLQIWDIAAGVYREPFQRHPGGVTRVAFLPDGLHALVCGTDGFLQAMDAASGAPVRTFTGHTWGMEASGGMPEEMDGPVEVALGWSSCWVEDLALSPDGLLAASASRDQTVRLWEVATGQCLRLLAGHTGQVFGVALTPDNRMAVSVCGAGSDHRRLWDAATGACIRTFRGTPLHEAVLTPDGRIVVSYGTFEFNGVRKDGLLAWDLATRQPAGLFEHDRVERLAVTPDGRTLLSAGQDQKIRMWDLRSGQCLRTLEGHTGWISGVAASADGRLVVSGGAYLDGTVRVWEAASGACLAVHYVGDDVSAVSGVRPDGRFACGTREGEVRFLSLRQIPQAPPIVTAVRRYVFELPDLPPRNEEAAATPAFAEGQPIPGDYEAMITAGCARCGHRFAVPLPVLDAIYGLSGHLAPDRAPCLALPDEAWDEPRLASACPRCRQPLRFNPFVVDNRDFAR